MSDDFDFSSLYNTTASPPAPPPGGLVGLAKALSKGIAGKILLSIAVSTIGGAIMNSGWIFKGVTSACAVIGTLGGDDAEKLKKKTQAVLHDGADAADGQPDAVHKPGIVAKVLAPIKEKAGDVAEKAGDKIDQAKEAGKQGIVEIKGGIADAKETADNINSTLKSLPTQNGPVAAQPPMADPQRVTLPQGIPPAVAQQLPQPGAPVPGPVPPGVALPPNLRAGAGGMPAMPKNMPTMPVSPYNGACPFCRGLIKVPPNQHKPRPCPTCGRPYQAAAARAAYAAMMMIRGKRP